MKNKKNSLWIILVVIVGIVFAYFIVANNNAKEQAQKQFDEYEARIIAGDVDECNHTIDPEDFPEIVHLQSLCFYKQGMNYYEDALFEDALNSFNESLYTSYEFHNEVEEMNEGILLLLNSQNINIIDQMFAFDMDNEFSFFNEMMAFIVKHPFNGSDAYLIKNQYLPQIVGLDNWTDGTYSFRFYGGTLYSDIPRFDHGSASKVFYHTQASGDTGWNISNDYGIITMEEDNGTTWSWEYRYLIVDLDTIKIYSMITNQEYILLRQISK